MRLSHQAGNFYDESIKNLVVRYDKCLNIGESMWQCRLKCGLLCKNKIVTIFLIVFLIPQNGTYFKNMPRIYEAIFPMYEIRLMVIWSLRFFDSFFFGNATRIKFFRQSPIS